MNSKVCVLNKKKKRTRRKYFFFWYFCLNYYSIGMNVFRVFTSVNKFVNFLLFFLQLCMCVGYYNIIGTCIVKTNRHKNFYIIKYRLISKSNDIGFAYCTKKKKNTHKTKQKIHNIE